jgi:hypothetical protein
VDNHVSLEIVSMYVVVVRDRDVERPVTRIETPVVERVS